MHLLWNVIDIIITVSLVEAISVLCATFLMSAEKKQRDYIERIGEI